MSSLPGFSGVKSLSGSEQRALVSAANWIGIDPYWLASVIKFETAGTFDPAKKNAAGSGATGLIQFMPSTARNLGTTTEALAQMSFTQQLEYVKKYFAPYRGKLRSLEDTYLVVFYPKLIGMPSNTPIEDRAYAQNKGFDFNSDGEITKNEITSTIRGVYNSAKNLPAITVTAIGMGAVFGWGVTAWVAYRVWKG